MQHIDLFSSCIVIDYENRRVLLVHNNIDDKWIQPGVRVEDDETPIQTCIRGVYEKTGVYVDVVNTIFEQDYVSPIDVKSYSTIDNNMIEIQYLGIPNRMVNCNMDNKPAQWFDIDNLDMNDQIDDEIKYKVGKLYKLFKNEKNVRARKKVV